ncbi:MAG: DinB family protein [Ktedonobacteraceae bacterium]
MNSTTLLQRQFQMLNDAFHDIADDLTDIEWLRRAVPDTNLFGFILWHLPRTQDAIIHILIRGEASVVGAEPWMSRGGLATPGIGFGSTLAETDQLACSLQKTAVLEYADAVHQSILSWLSTLSADDLDLVPNLLAHAEQAGAPDLYPALRSTALDLEGRPVWGLLAGTCLSHLRAHLAELDLLKRILRGQVRSSE